mmetsp:Transcript_11972/g.26784  ORF Transcript_11972/g.26784 Transcript_11972/m.26784 type:complete len:82 (+) Transcript_11972:3408-3653(+)
MMWVGTQEQVARVFGTTSLFLDEVSVPKVLAFSSTSTSFPEMANALATASPTTPAPITATSTFSIDVVGMAAMQAGRRRTA